MNELEQYGSPIYQEGPAPKLISRRLYNVVLTGLVVLSFVVMAACSYFTNTITFAYFVIQNPLAYMLATIGGSIVGLICMSIGRSKENLALALVGYAVFSLTFGFTTSFALSYYSLASISMAFSATAGIMVVFGAAGIMFPQFFARIQGIICFGLLAMIVVELVLIFLGVQQTFTDIVVVLLFCGFIGYDVYRAQADTPTLVNALWYAIELYLDIVNVLLRLLRIFGNRD